MSVPEALKKLRKTVGLTQKQLAEKANVSLGTYRTWEQGTAGMPLEMALAIAQALDCTPNDLCGWPPGLNEGFAESLKPEEGELLYCYRQSTEKRRSKILETARDQAELSQAQPAAPEGEGLEADQIKSA